MADDKPSKDAAAKADGRGKTAPRSKAQAEFDRYKARVAAPARAAAPAGFAGPPAFSIGLGAATGPTMMAGSPWGGDGPYAGLGLPYGAMQAPPPLPPNSLTDRLRYTLRLGVDVVNATLSGGLRVLGGLSDAADWAGGMYAPRGGGHAGHAGHGGHGACGCGQSSCGCGDCCTSHDPCCNSGVSSCGCGCC